MTTYALEPEDLDQVEALAHKNPMPSDLREQIGNWIEPQTMNTETDHRDAMACIAIAYPLIKAYIAEREATVHENPALAEQIRQGINDAEHGRTVDLGSFAQYLKDE
jgi:hypothetical protein